MRKLIVAAVIACSFAAPATAAPVELICEHPRSHQQVHVSIELNEHKVHYTDPFGKSADFSIGDTLKNPYDGSTVHFHFGPQCRPGGPLCEYFLNFDQRPRGYAATLDGGLGHESSDYAAITEGRIVATTWKAYCIVPGRIVQ
jgi:hypothetical protein